MAWLLEFLASNIASSCLAFINSFTFSILVIVDVTPSSDFSIYSENSLPILFKEVAISSVIFTLSLPILFNWARVEE